MSIDTCLSRMISALERSEVWLRKLREGRRRGSCPKCRALLSEAARGVYRCEKCRRGEA